MYVECFEYLKRTKWTSVRFVGYNVFGVFQICCVCAYSFDGVYGIATSATVAFWLRPDEIFIAEESAALPCCQLNFTVCSLLIGGVSQNTYSCSSLSTWCTASSLLGCPRVQTNCSLAIVSWNCVLGSVFLDPWSYLFSKMLGMFQAMPCYTVAFLTLILILHVWAQPENSPRKQSRPLPLLCAWASYYSPGHNK